MTFCIRNTARVVGIGIVLLIGCSGPSEPTGASPESSSPSLPSAPRSEVLVATTMTTADLVQERVCLDHEGPHVLEAEAESENAATGFLTLDDGSEEGEYVTSAMRFAGDPRRVRSEEVVLHAGEPCYLVSAQTGIVGDRATTRLIRLAADE
jgi:hypothetical protein